MIKMLIGIALVTLELTITKGNMIISVFPDFAGFILLLLGQRELAHENDHFYKNVKFSLWCATVGLMIFIMDLLGVTAAGNGQSFMLQLLLMVLEPICLFRIVRGVQQAGKDYDLDVKGKLFFGVWLAMTILSVFSVVGVLVSGLESLANFAGMILTALSFAYIALFFNFKCVYEEIQPPKEEKEEDEY